MHYTAMPSEIVRAYQRGEPDIHGQSPERTTSDGGGNPCRHCLRGIPEGAGMLILAHRPFAELHPYAEAGPIFLCADPCARGGGVDLPQILQTSPDYLVKGYGADNRIVYGTGAVVPTGQIAHRAAELLSEDAIAYVHVRSARNNCYLARIDRGETG
ncbi:hypothetical protein A8B82_13500 [Sulfitobacter sp. EhC04]|uniref:DUF1203 domain-containing protein n=1 Tax=Sulfitobacter sp. EhC04 TaxID=1849168 RepID=UPI0007F379E1|nr:DUF1203 domain-containing protein [Sulfitobacter sp. EhC04]OAN77210.1 hypothetical protein A8B82_13500 [Sulfitobacter sp. EhC04]